MPTPKQYPNAAARQAAYRLRCQESASGGRAGGTTPLPVRLGRRRWEAMCGQARGLLTQLGGEMEAYVEARAEAWQESARGEAFQETLEAVTQAADALDEVSFR